MGELPSGFPSVFDPDGSVTASLGGGRASPTTFFLDQKGEVVNVKIGAYATAGLLEKDLRRFRPGKGGVVADPAAGVGVLAALFAGLVSFLSPCVLPLVPGYLSAVTGVPPSELDRAPAWRVLGPSLLFVASFSAIFILLGLTATGLGSSLQEN